MRTTPNGANVTTIGLAVNRNYTGKDGQKVEETSFFDVVFWNRQAETISQYVTKGKPLLVEGRLQSRSWEAQDGQKRTKVEVVADNFTFLGGQGGGQGLDEQVDAPAPDELPGAEVPF